MKTLVIIKNANIGGAERLAIDEVNELYRRGNDVTLVTLGPEWSEHSFLLSCLLPEAKKVCVPFRSLADIGAWRRLIAVLQAQRPDVVVTHLWFANTVGRIAARFAGISKVISFEHNVYDRVKSRKQFFVDRLLQRLSFKIVAVSEAVRDSLVAHGIKPSRVVVIENGIDLSRYTNAQPFDIRKEQGLDAGPIFLFVGRLIEQKGVDVLLNAFAQVPNASLLIAGDGPDRQKLEQQANELNISAHVYFLGFRPDIPALMKSVDCLILPSRWEGQGLVIPEAFAAGLPVIAADFPPAFSMVKNDENGFIVPRENAEALARAMERMCDTSLRERLAVKAVQSASRFSIQRHIDELLANALDVS